MSIIYQSISEEIKRKSDEPDKLNLFIKDLFKLYTPKDLNKQKENLLTIYLNEAPDITQLKDFLNAGYKIQSKKIKSKNLEKCLNYLKKEELLESLPKLLDIRNNIAYTCLTLPTVKSYELFLKYHQKDFKYVNSKFNIFNDIFVLDKINFKSNNQLNEYLGDIFTALQTIVVDGGISYQDIQCLKLPAMFTRVSSLIINLSHYVPMSTSNDLQGYEILRGKTKAMLNNWYTELESLCIKQTISTGEEQITTKEVKRKLL